LYYKFETIPANEIAFAFPLSWISQETPLPQASWNFHIKAVWNTAARLHLNEHNPTWLQNLACDIPEANWHVNNIASQSICNARHAETAPGLKKFEKLHSDKMNTTIWSHRPTLGDVAPLPHHFKPGLTLEFPDWKFWIYTDNSCYIQGGTTVIGAGVYHPSSGNSNLIEPNNAGITDTTERAEPAAIVAAITHNHIHIATDSLTSIHQIRKQLLCPEKHRHHVQGDILKILSNTIQNSQSHFVLYKVKSHAGIAGNECADALAYTKLAMETASQLKQPPAPQALVAIPSLILAG